MSTGFEQFFTAKYNEHKPLVAQMSDSDLDSHISELQQICAEAKAVVQAALDEQRQRRGKLSSSQREWLTTPTEPNQLVSDAIAAVKVRKDRMSKADKLQEQMKAAGLDISFIQEAMSKVKVTDTKTVGKPLADKRPTFNAAPTVHNTQESLLADITSHLATDVKLGIRSADDLASAARTAAHIANKVTPGLTTPATPDSETVRPSFNLANLLNKKG